MIMDIVKIHCIVFGRLWTLTNLKIALMLFLPMCTYWGRGIGICFKEVLKDALSLSLYIYIYIPV